MQLDDHVRTVRVFVGARGGNVALVSAAFFTAAIACASLAIDLGMLYVERRSAQGAVDLAAIAAANDLSNAEAAARATLLANGVSNIRGLTVTLGSYQANQALSPESRFVPNGVPTNAARVELGTQGDLYFAHRIMGRDDVDIGVSAVASSASEATFSIGSRLLSLNGGISNKVLGALLGSTVSLSVMDYEALANADVQLVDFLNALATEAHVTTGTYSHVLNSSLTVGQILRALSSVTSVDGNATASTALQTILSPAGNGTSLSVPLSKVINLGTLANAAIGSAGDGISASFAALDVLSSCLGVANAGRQLTLDLTASAPGLASLTLELAIGEPMQTSPWAAVGQAGSLVHTAQTRLKLTGRVLGTGILSGVYLSLPLYIELANATGRLAEVSCIDGDQSASVAVSTGIATVWLGQPAGSWTDLTHPATVNAATLLSTPVLKASAAANVTAGSNGETLLSFDEADISAGTLKTANSNAASHTLVSTLLTDTQIQVNIVGLSLITPAVLKTAVRNALTPVAATMDGVLTQVLDGLGVGLGEADVRVNGVRCRNGTLCG